jgi:hypothetical protein
LLVLLLLPPLVPVAAHTCATAAGASSAAQLASLPAADTVVQVVPFCALVSASFPQQAASSMQGLPLLEVPGLLLLLQADAVAAATNKAGRAKRNRLAFMAGQHTRGPDHVKAESPSLGPNDPNSVFAVTWCRALVQHDAKDPFEPSRLHWQANRFFSRLLRTMARMIKVALNHPRTAVGILMYAKHVAACMTGNPYFPSPTLPIATLVAHIAELEAAEILTGTRTRGAATDRDAKLSTVMNDLRQLRTYVETLANQHAEDAEAVVVSAGMSVKESAGPSKAAFAVKQGKVSGSVKLSVRHPGVVASFYWQSSTDGVHYIDRESTTWAHQDIDGLTPGILYHFRYRTLTGDVMSDWSDPLTLLVV